MGIYRLRDLQIQINLQQIYKIMENDNVELIEQFEIEKDKEQNSQSHRFTNIFEYYISLIGLSVGFGSFWRFPYMMYENGGGAFLVPYTIAFFIIGIPVMYLEITIGNVYGVSLPFVFAKINKGLKIFGLSFIIYIFYFCGFYNILLTYCYRYIFTAFISPLPFAEQSPLDNGYFSDVVLEKTSSIEEYGGIQWPLFLIYNVSLYILYLIIKNGVKSSTKIAMYTAILPYFFFLILAIRGLFLPGGIQGLAICLSPNFSKLLSGKVWVQAFVQVFFQLNLCASIIVNLTAIKPNSQKNLKGLFLVPIMSYLCGILCASCVFMYLNYQATVLGLSFYDLKLSGLELSFNVFPKALATLPLPNLWVLFFYIILVFLGIDSLFGTLQAIICYISDQVRINGVQINIMNRSLNFKNMKAVLLSLFFFFSIFLTSKAGIFYIEFINRFVFTIFIGIGSFIEYFLFTEVLPFEQLKQYAQKKTGQESPKWIIYILNSKFLKGFFILNLVLSLIAIIEYIQLYSWKFSIIGLFLGFSTYFVAYFYWRMYKQDSIELRLPKISATSL